MVNRRRYKRAIFSGLAGCFLALTQSGCLHTQLKNEFLKDDWTKQSFVLPYGLAKVQVIDKRTDKKPQEMKVSNFAMPGTKEESTPEISEQVKTLIQSELTKYFSTSKKPLVVARVEILKGSERFDATWFSEKETVETKIKVSLVDIPSSSTFIYATGESTYYVKSINASKEYIAKLYEKSIRASLYKAVEAINGAVEGE